MRTSQENEYLPFVQALAAGKTVQTRSNTLPQGWRDLGPDDEIDGSLGDYYRIKPEPKRRDSRLDEIPLGAWLRNKKRAWTAIITAVGEKHFVVGNNSWLYRCTIWDKLECSFDGGKTWLPCGVQE